MLYIFHRWCFFNNLMNKKFESYKNKFQRISSFRLSQLSNFSPHFTRYPAQRKRVQIFLFAFTAFMLFHRINKWSNLRFGENCWILSLVTVAKEIKGEFMFKYVKFRQLSTCSSFTVEIFDQLNSFRALELPLRYTKKAYEFNWRISCFNNADTVSP